MNIIQRVIDHLRRVLVARRLAARHAQLSQMYAAIRDEQDALDEAGYKDEADSLVPFLQDTAVELRLIESQLRAIGA